MQESHEQLFAYISQYISLSKKDLQLINEYFEYIFVSKNTILEEENKPTQYLYFIIDGYVRVYYMNDGEDRTTQINCPSRFITSFQSFITQSEAYDNVQTITNCSLLRITKRHLDELNNKINNWTNFSEMIYEKALIFNEERTRDMILLNAEERYKKLLNTQADILQNVPIQHIASYIGIKPESLSRIRRNINF